MEKATEDRNDLISFQNDNDYTQSSDISKFKDQSFKDDEEDVDDIDDIYNCFKNIPNNPLLQKSAESYSNQISSMYSKV